MAIRVLVVDDSAFMRKVLSDILDEDKDVEIIGTARNGKDALEKITHNRPDVITLDVEMPLMDGIATLKEIMVNFKIPVVMLSSLTSKGADLTLQALEIGAIDFITKPTSIFNMDNANMKLELVEKVKAASKVIVNNNLLKKYSKENDKPLDRTVNRNDKLTNIVAIGTSTGGPRALQSIIPQLPQNINSSILIVQHMPPGFTKSLADRLNSISNINVKEAEDKEVLKEGFCYIAPGDQHMRVLKKNNKIEISLSKDDPVSGHRPSVDILMNSIAELNGINIVGVLLTGMGSDGAEGLNRIYKKSGHTIAQNEESCIVFGMPKSAINLGGVKCILPLNMISKEIIDKLEV